MACGCGKAMRNTSKNYGVIGPIHQAANRNISQGISIQSTTNNTSTSNLPDTSATMDEERRRIEKLRREAIKKALNK